MVELDRIICGDCLEVLKTLPTESVDCCITSPPYYGLRDYGIEGQIGLEPTPEAYVARLVEVFREVKRVLKPEAVAWINLGDSYAGSCMTGGNNGFNASGGDDGFKIARQFKRKLELPNGLKPKDLIGIPWMVAFALRADGWYLRSDIIWHKPNCMPESVTDRPTKSHEYLFLLSKSQRYYYDAEAIKEPHSGGSHKKRSDLGATPSEKVLIAQGKATYAGLGAYKESLSGRNKRTVWTIPTKPFKEAHFATFPEALVEPCILAGTSERGYCPECGKPWVRQVESSRIPDGNRKHPSPCGSKKIETDHPRLEGGFVCKTCTIGWLPSCQCASKPRPGIVLDPFSGAGTVALVAKKLGRHYIGIELNPAYIEMAKTRINKIPPSLSRWVEDARP